MLRGGHLGWIDELGLHLHAGCLRHGHLVLVLLRLHHLLLLHHAWVVAVHDLLLLGLDGHASQRVDVLRIHVVLLDNVLVHRWHASILNEVLHSEQIKALLLEPLKELLLLEGPKVSLVLWHVASKTARLRQLLLKSAFLSLSRRVWSDTLPSEVVKHLTWDFLKGLLGELHRVVREVAERHELHDIRGHLLLVDLGVEGGLVSVELVHGGKVGGTYTDDDD